MSSSTSDHETNASSLTWKSTLTQHHGHFTQRPRSHTLPTNPGPIAGQLEHLQQLGVAPFLKSLYTILSLEDPMIVGWTVDGRAFEVRDQDRLSHVILPKYFRHQKFSSFQRQLNYFGFKKLTKSHANVCTYLREHFHRHSPRALILIKRKTNGARQRQLSLDHLEPGYDHSPRALLESEYFYSGSSSTPETSTSSSASISNHMSHPPALQLPPTRFHPHAQHHHHHHPFVNPANTANPNVSAFGNYRNFMHQHQHPLPPHPTHTQNPPYWDNTQYWVLSTESPANPGIDQILYEGEEDSGSAQKFECAHPLMSTKGSSDEMSASDLVALRDAVALICDDDELLGSSPESSENHHQPVEMDKENIKVEQKPRSKNKSPVSAKEEEKSTSVYATV